MSVAIPIVAADGAQGTVTVSAPATGTVSMDSFAGATDDAKLAAAMTYAAAQTYKPAIQLPPRSITFNTGGLVPYNGMRIIGPPGAYGPKDQEVSPSLTNHQVTLNVGMGTSAWFNGTATVYDVYIGNIAFFNPGVNGQFWNQPIATAPGLYACQFDSLGFYGFKSIFGNSTTSCAMTQVSFTGHWVVIGFTDMAMNLQYSDSSFWADAICNMGTGVAPPAAGTPYVQLQGGRTRIGFLYPTTISTWTGLNLIGAPSNGANTINNMVVEGTSSNNATYPLVTVSGGSWTINNSMFDWLNPAAGVNGVIQQSGGQLTLNSPRYQRASAASASFPLVYQTGGHCCIYDAYSLTNGESINFRQSDGTIVTPSPGQITYH